MLQETVPKQPVIGAERFILRPLRRSDAGLIAMYTADKRLAMGTRTIPHPLPPGATEAFIARALADRRSEDVWAMDGSAQGLDEVLGLISLNRIEPGQSEVGFWVAPGMWNAGFASEALAALIAANPHKANTLLAEVFQDNPGSARVLSHCDFEYLGDAEAWSVARGARVATWTYIKKLD
ncbi:GNAT family N-acetyltransferase [Phaeovulum sp.]|uniref:GNAT family N-acetyltransferase n=1 Tax=Phaeovulum sp. TaxID=2934796 RepID=UPI00273199B4|nr:GNAT family N-acetyltransferase [Phaeovulum sp.]MDP1670376.1 GNAT family N-acetyltransferase [Phaeovulum sp.]MDP3861035.1 GNAT family N-acetyltransferase [Phaeovulum sp.]MDZ4120705.1 GNAT family N-acetyltransferase [Phaeovulum sp.]